jgi:hypothetical protein
MKNRIKVISIIAIAAAGGLAWMGAQAKGSTGLGTIDRIVHRDDRSVIIYRSGVGDWENPDSCTGSRKVILAPIAANGPDPELFGEQLNTVLTAFTTGKAVSFGVDGCFAQNSGDTIPVVTLISIYNDVEVIAPSEPAD